MTGHREIGIDLQAAGAIGGHAQPFRGRRCAHTSGPDDRARRQALVAIDDALGTAVRHGMSERHFDAELFQRVLRIAGQLFRKIREHALPGLDQHHPGRARIDIAEIVGQCCPRHLGNGAGKLNAGRAGADDDKILRARRDRQSPRRARRP
jgi:hypothetical protein